MVWKGECGCLMKSVLGNLWKLNYALNIRGCEYLIDNRTCLWYAKVSMRKCVQNRKYRFFRK